MRGEKLTGRQAAIWLYAATAASANGEAVSWLRGVLTVWKFIRLNLQNSVSIAKELKTGGAVWIRIR